MGIYLYEHTRHKVVVFFAFNGMNMLLSNMNINMPFTKGHMGALSYYILQIRYSGGTDILEPKALKEFIGS